MPDRGWSTPSHRVIGGPVTWSGQGDLYHLRALPASSVAYPHVALTSSLACAVAGATRAVIAPRGVPEAVAERAGRRTRPQPRPIADVQALRVVERTLDWPGGQHRHTLLAAGQLVVRWPSGSPRQTPGQETRPAAPQRPRPASIATGASVLTTTTVCGFPRHRADQLVCRAQEVSASYVTALNLHRSCAPRLRSPRSCAAPRRPPARPCRRRSAAALVHPGGFRPGGHQAVRALREMLHAELRRGRSRLGQAVRGGPGDARAGATHRGGTDVGAAGLGAGPVEPARPGGSRAHGRGSALAIDAGLGAARSVRPARSSA